MIEPGDTWDALAQRYGIEVDVLQADYGHINTSRQPAIGTSIKLEPTEPEVTGALRRTADGGLLQTALSNQQSPWQLALLNSMVSPYEPGLWQPLLVPGSELLRELPVSGQTLALTPAIPVPGQALVAHIGLDEAGAIAEVALDDIALATTTQNRNSVAVGGIGAFAEPGQPELSVQIERRPGLAATVVDRRERLGLPTTHLDRRSGGHRSGVYPR